MGGEKGIGFKKWKVWELIKDISRCKGFSSDILR